MTPQSTNQIGQKQVPHKATKRKRAPRTIDEANISYVGSPCCVRCSINRRKCIFRDNSTQQCTACESKGVVCQLIGSSFIHKNKQSKLGRRNACDNCAARKQSCKYEEEHTNEWDYNVSCSYCKRNGKCCWPLTNFSGMWSNTSKMLSGVDNAFVQSNDLGQLLAQTTFEAAANFKPTVDHPLNFNGIISSLRPRRARNNFGLIKREFKLGDHLYQEIVSYGSGCGATSVGTTYNSNYLRPITNDMNDLRIKVQTILRKYTYLAPFLKEDFNHVQFSINGGKGVGGISINTPTIIQTGLHCDVAYSFSKERGIHCKESKNSQVPNSIVAILTIGHPRILTMERVKWENGTTEKVLETRHFVLSHHSLFLLHPTDERPSRRDGSNNDILSYWRHGNVRLACSNPLCKDRCHAPQCSTRNSHIVSFSLAFRTCCHSRIIDARTSLEPLRDDVRAVLNLDALEELHKERNEKADKMLNAYQNDGTAEIFNIWLRTATRKVMQEFYTGKD